MTDIKLAEFAAWLTARRYSPRTVEKYTYTLKCAAEKCLNFVDIEGLDVEDAYRILFGRNAPCRHTARAACQGIKTYRDYLDRGESA